MHCDLDSVQNYYYMPWKPVYYQSVTWQLFKLSNLWSAAVSRQVDIEMSTVYSKCICNT